MSLFQQVVKVTSKLNVLYVEDNIELRSKMHDIFNDLFNNVDVAEDGNEGYNKYIEYHEKNGSYYDMVITDIKMPNLNGVELSKKLLSINKKQNIIVVSAHDDSEYLIDLINMGVNRFIQKPLILDNVLKSIYEVSKDIISDKNNCISNMMVLSEGYIWDKNLNVLKKDDKVVALSASETVLITTFINNPSVVFSGEDVYNLVYNSEYDKDISFDSVRSLLKRLRKKLPKDMIINVYGKGYKINPDLV